MLKDTLESDQSLQYGPYVFGGDKIRMSCAAAMRAAEFATRVNNVSHGTGLGSGRRGGKDRSDVREGFAGSSIHLDGMGTLTAVGGVKGGIKVLTAIEADDASRAFLLGKFKLYAKPGGSPYLINPPIDRCPAVLLGENADSVKEVWISRRQQ